jgi:hypothetical protein
VTLGLGRPTAEGRIPVAQDGEADAAVARRFDSNRPTADIRRADWDGLVWPNPERPVRSRDWAGKSGHWRPICFDRLRAEAPAGS